MKMNLRNAVLLVIAFFGLSACSDGGSAAPVSPPPPPPVDMELDWDQGNWDEENWQ